MIVKINADTMKDIMSFCPKMCAHAGGARELLERVCFRFHHDGTAEAVGLDGYAMGVYYFIYGSDEPIETEILIEPIKVPKCNECTIEQTDDLIKISFDNGMVYYQNQLDGKYIDIDRVQKTEKETTLQIVFSRKLLSNALASMKHEDDIILTFTNNCSPVMIDGVHSRAMILPKRLSGSVEDNYKHMYDKRSKR